MAKKQCKNGHIYDSGIYGDNCPFCPAQGGGTEVNAGNRTVVNNGEAAGGPGERTFAAGETGPTIPVGDNFDMPGGGTVIRPVNGGGGSGKKLVGFLVTYDIKPEGTAFNLYEGRNYIGRDVTSDICIPNDSQVSGRHVSILYRSVDNRFKFRDEQSSNGTFVNEVLEDDGELKNYDRIRIGSTRLLFIAIPQF